ncbi:protein IQ-DOMAIN 10-like isoform X1 [Bidens hawaiensis]|uniref:protein IQ-DOMAIN 10-like isoform X1 n=1 Tax=Bidens hawaiensis TaxID=980011 RepID=UPI00404A704B
MGACGWVKMLFGVKRKNENRPEKREQIQQDSKISNGSRSRDSSVRESSSRVGSTKVIGRSTGTREFAATRIQNAYHSYRARKAVRCLKGTSRFQELIEADALSKQASSALNKIHFWSKIQMEIRNRRHWMVAEGRMKQRKFENQVKFETKLHELEVEWCGGPETMEEIVSRMQQREEATNKRERAMAYAFYHQWRANSNRYFGQAYYDLSKESWGWSWKERWIAVCPWEARVVVRAKPGKKTKHGGGNGGAPKIVVAVKTHVSNGRDSIKGAN